MNKNDVMGMVFIWTDQKRKSVNSVENVWGILVLVWFGLKGVGGTASSMAYAATTSTPI